MSDTFTRVHKDHTTKSGAIKAMLDRARGHYQSPKLVRLHLALENAHAAVRAFEQLAGNRSPTITPESHALKVSAASKKLADAALRYEAEIYAEHSRLRADIDGQIRTKSKLEPLPSGAEIRQALRQMPEADRLKAISRAFESGDHEILSAIVHGNTITSNVPDQMRIDYIREFETRMAPELVAERAQLDGLLEDAAHPLRQAREVAKNSTDEKYIAEIQAADAAAKQIEANFEASLGGEAVASSHFPGVA